MRDKHVGATVILVNGQRLAWKIQRGVVPPAHAFGQQHFQRGWSPSMCDSESARFAGLSAWERASAWVRGFSRHPDAIDGFEP